MTRLDEIPTTSQPPPGARPSEVVARIRALRPSRRAVLRGLVIGAAATALVPLDWYLTRREAAAQAAGGDDEETDDRSEHMSCMPSSYTEEANNWPAGGTAICYGGWRRGSFPCSDGYHREGAYTAEGETLRSTRLATNCEGKNAWRWNGYRCSDAMTECHFDDGTRYTSVTIAACLLPETTTPAPGDDEDPSQPKKVVPDLGVSMRALPGIGSMAGR